MSPANYVEITEDGRGLVVLRYVGVVPNDDWARHLDRCEEINRRGTHAAIHDCREIGRLPAKQRQMLTKWLKDHAMLLRQNECACAIVLATSWQRAFLRGIEWVTTFPMPMKVFSTIEDATDWATAALVEAKRAG